MNLLRKIQIVTASMLVGLSLSGCSQQGETSSLPSATSEAAAQSPPPITASTPTNNPPVPPLLPEVTIPTSTNESPPATPISVRI